MISEKIKKLVDDLNYCKNETEFHDTMSAIELSSDEISKYIMFDSHFYTRNLIYKTRNYELLLLCWNKDQRSPPHDHNGQSCWLKVISGQIHEVRYDPKIKSFVEMLARLKSSDVINVGEVSHINDKLAYHNVSQHGNNRTISLHLYAKPIEHCRIFTSSNKTPKEKTLGYFSEGGVRLSEKIPCLR